MSIGQRMEWHPGSLTETIGCPPGYVAFVVIFSFRHRHLIQLFIYIYHVQSIGIESQFINTLCWLTDSIHLQYRIHYSGPLVNFTNEHYWGMKSNLGQPFCSWPVSYCSLSLSLINPFLNSIIPSFLLSPNHSSLFRQHKETKRIQVIFVICLPDYLTFVATITSLFIPF